MKTKNQMSRLDIFLCSSWLIKKITRGRAGRNPLKVKRKKEEENHARIDGKWNQFGGIKIFERLP